MRIVTITAPSIEPLTLDDAKLHARVDITDDDVLINYYIQQAREYCEKYCNIGLITQTKAVYYDECDLSRVRDYIVLPVGPIQSVVSITYYDEDANPTVVDPSYYYISGSTLIFNNSFIMPNKLRQFDSWEYRVVIGFGDNATDVPMQIRLAMLRLVAHDYQNREAQYDAVNDGISSQNVRNSVTADLGAYRKFFL
jgi:uncharacterized phiE125 gp8 family phage protein